MNRCVDSEFPMNPESAPLAWPKERKVLSTAIPRLDGAIKANGRAKYAYDVNPPGLLYGRILRSPHAAATIKRIDLDRARALPGVRAIVLVEGVKPGARVRYQGDEILGLAAVSKQAADDALRAVVVEYEVLPHVVNVEPARAGNAPRVFEKSANVANPKPRLTGDAEAVFRDPGAIVVEGTFRTPVQIHCPLETHGLTARWDGDELTVWASTQGVFSVREGLAQALGIPQNQVRCLCDVMGGGFGAKFGPGVEGILAAKLAREAKAPVKMMLDRKGQFLAVGNRPNTVQNLRLAADRSGKLRAFSCEGYGTGGLSGGGNSEGGGGGVEWPAPYIYGVPNVAKNIVRVLTNTGAGRAFRAPQHPSASVGMEGMMDLLAYRLGLDPVELRLLNDGNKTRQEEFRLGAEKFGWRERFHPPGKGLADGPWRRGVGVAAAAWGSGGSGTKAEASIHPDGSVEVKCGTQDLGTGSRTLVAIVAAETFGLRPEDITVRIGDTALPPSGASGGSTTSPSVAPAVRVACVRALDALHARVGADPGDWRTRCARLGVESVSERGEWQPGLSGAGVGGVQFAQVAVDVETGRVRVERVVVVQDAGLIVNKLGATSQVHGGVLQGLGYALFEERVMDDQTGIVLNANFETYKLPTIADTPVIEVHFLDQPERGVIGLAEAVHIPTAAAIANAVHNAIGVRVWELPMTPARVLASLATV